MAQKKGAAKTVPRNKEIGGGVSRFGRASSYHHKGIWAVKSIKNKTVAKKAVSKAAPEPKTKPFGKNGKRTIARKTAAFYPAEDVATPKVRNFTPKPAKLRASITPGTVLVLLAGRHRGKRVVFLKALPSGLLLVTGPFRINGVPLRRVNQAYVIATSTKVDLTGVKIDDKLNDSFFGKPAAEKKTKGESQFFAEDAKTKKKADPAKVKLQQDTDSALLTSLKKTPAVVKYLGSKFSLKSGQYPHLLKF